MSKDTSEIVERQGHICRNCDSQGIEQFVYRKGMFRKEYEQGWRWIVWVAGVADYYTEFGYALYAMQDKYEEGYEDVVLEKIIV